MRFDGEHFSGASEAALGLVGDKEDAVIATAFTEPLNERPGCRDVAALSNDRLDDDRCDFVRWNLRGEQAVKSA